jgi:CubicO group peptidase (beta-lactamase class C family)
MKFLLNFLFLFLTGSVVSCAQQAEDRHGVSADPHEQIQRFEDALPAVHYGGKTLQLSLTEWMEALAVPGVSIAVIDDYEIIWAKGFGLKKAGADNEPVSEETLFQVASISKPVTALALMHHAERGQFDLDAEINNYLRSWMLPENNLNSDQKVTLRGLLSHTAGITPGGYPGYQGDGMLPDIVQVLEGMLPANSSPTRSMAVPGSGLYYSGPGYSMIQLALEDHLDRSFDEIVSESVFRPLGLENSTFEQELSEEYRKRVSSGHYYLGDLLPGGWFRYPEMAAAGLWTTPSDLAEIFIEMARALTGASNRIVSDETVREMLNPQLGQVGLGFMIRPDNDHGFFTHSGRNQGFISEFRMFGKLGKGAVITTNSDAGGYLTALMFIAVAQQYEWPGADQLTVTAGLAKNIMNQVRNVQKPRIEIELNNDILQSYTGTYELEPGFNFEICREDNRLLLRLPNQSTIEMIAETETGFFSKTADIQITFVTSENEQAEALILSQQGREFRALRIE